MSRISRTDFVLVTSALFALTTSHASLAQEHDKATTIQVEAQPLATALQEFSEQSGLQVAYVATLAENVNSKGTRDAATPVDALAQILDSTGLEYQFVNDDTVAVTTVNKVADEGGDSDSKNLRPAPILMAQATPSQTPSMATQSENDDSATSVVTGKVMDARTGTNLKGALITIEETGQSTSTNDLGEFRFPRVASGDYTIRVSYLGYLDQLSLIQVSDEDVFQGFALKGGSDLEEIVVFGQRSARALALNEERTAANSITVLSADILGRFEGTTIAESLRRAPGVAFQQDQFSGEGTNIIIRGLDSDFNMVTLNGLRLPEPAGRFRSPNLNNILTESIAKVTINKTLLPSQDGSGTGGLVEIETKQPLDRARRFASVSVRTGQTQGDFQDDLLASATLSGVFGDSENLGIGVSVQHRANDVSSLRFSNISSASPPLNIGPYLPLAADGSVITSPSQIDPRSRFPFEPGVDEIYPVTLETSLRQGEVENNSITVSGQWRPRNHTTLSLDYIRIETSEDEFTRDATFRPLVGYIELPIDELQGEPRGALIWTDALEGNGIPGNSTSLQSAYRVVLDREETTDVLSFTGDTVLGPWSYSYSLGYTEGKTDSPFESSVGVNRTGGVFDAGLVDIAPAFLQPLARNNTVAGRIVSPFAPLSGSFGPSLPLLTPEGFAEYDDPSSYVLNQVDIRSILGSNERSTARIDVTYDLPSEVIGYLKAGLFIEELVAKSVNLPSRFGRSVDGSRIPITDLGLRLEQNPLARIDRDGGFNVVDRESIERFVLGADTNQLLTFLSQDLDERILKAETAEQDTAFYLESQLGFGDVEVIGGARLERVRVDATNLTNPSFRDALGNRDDAFAEQFAVLVDHSATQEKWLPRVLVNYRHGENTIIRGGYFRTVARPRIQDLSTTQRVSLDLRERAGPLRDQPLLQITEGNPQLKPAATNNFDLSIEHYDDNIGILKLSVFYKTIENFLEFNATNGNDQLEGVVLPDDPRFAIENLPSNIFVQRVRPFNNDEDAKIWGGELAIEKQLAFLPGPWAGLGVYGNYTYTKSAKKVFDQFFDPVLGETVDIELDDIPFRSQPEDFGTFAVTYNRAPFDGSLSYTWQARRLSSFQDFGLSQYLESDDSLDLRLEYFLDNRFGSWRIFFEGADLLKDNTDSDVETSVGGEGGVPRIYTNGSYFGGRIFRLGVVGSFQ